MVDKAYQMCYSLEVVRKTSRSTEKNKKKWLTKAFGYVKLLKSLR